MQASGILLTISNGHRQQLEMYAQGMVQHSPSASVTTDGRATFMVVEELEEGLACTVGKCDMTELSSLCLHRYRATTQTFLPKFSFEKCQDVRHVALLAPPLGLEVV